MNRRPYPSDVSDEEWEFVAPYLSLLPQTAAQRRHDRREVFTAVRSIVRSCALYRAYGRALAVAADQFSALGGGRPTDAPLSSPPAALRPLSRICACSCERRRDGVRSPAPPSWTVARCARGWRVG